MEPLEKYLRPEVAAFARLMEKRLRENDHKPGWKNDHPSALATRIKDETDELYEVLFGCVSVYKETRDRCRPLVAKEAADVANFAMMVSDVCGALDYDGCGSLRSPSPAPALPESDRELYGQMVRMEWVAWAREQPNPKPSWLRPWRELTEAEKEVDRRIGERLVSFGMSFRAAVDEHTSPAPAPSLPATEGEDAAEDVALAQRVLREMRGSLTPLGVARKGVDKALACLERALAALRSKGGRNG